MKFEHGLGTIVNPESDRPFNEIPTTSCMHCGKHFPLPSFADDPVSKANRIGRGFCMNCNGFICGEACQNCLPIEKQLEIWEGTRNPTAVSAAVPKGQIWTPGAA